MNGLAHTWLLLAPMIPSRIDVLLVTFGSAPDKGKYMMIVTTPRVIVQSLLAGSECHVVARRAWHESREESPSMLRLKLDRVLLQQLPFSVLPIRPAIALEVNLRAHRC
jgi:hypothetical protein